MLLEGYVFLLHMRDTALDYVCVISKDLQLARSKNLPLLSRVSAGLFKLEGLEAGGQGPFQVRVCFLQGQEDIL